MNDTPQSRWRGLLGPLLLASLMVNLFVIGGMIGDRFASDFVTQSPPPPIVPEPGVRQRPALLREVIAQLPAEERQLVNEAFAQRRHDTRAARDRVAAARARAKEMLGAEPLDPAALTNALADLRGATGALQAAIHSALIETAPRLSFETRRKFAESLRGQ